MKLYNCILGIFVVGLTIFLSYLVSCIPILWARFVVSYVLGITWTVTFVVFVRLSE